MSLILTLTISNNYLSDRDNHFVFDECGGSIGRNPDNDVVLPDPNHYLSRKHALISYQDGAYYLTDNSENGVFLNHSNEPVGKNNSIRLGDGNCLSLGEHELRVSIEQSQHADIPGQYGAGRESIDLGAAPSPWGAVENRETSSDILDGSAQSAEVPDYSSQDSDIARSNSAMQPAAEPNHSAAEQDFFMPPSTHEESTPLDWDKTGFVPAADSGSQLPDWDKTDFVAPIRPEEQVTEDSDRNKNMEGSPVSVPKMQTETKPPVGGTQSSEYKPAEPAQYRSAPANSEPTPVGGQVSPEQSTAGMDLLQAFLQGAGVKIEQLSPEDAKALMKLQGRLYRDIVQGMMEVLRARFDLKNEFRMRQTQIQIRENNPLKFIGQVDDAIENLILKRSSGFMEPEAAFQEGFQDIKDHQIAMVVGMRAAFEALLRRFDPDQLEQKFARGDKIGDILPLYKKANCWEHYQEWFADISASAEDDFQGLFGNEFTRAYEDQMARLSLLRRKPGK